jgi:nitroimidazol reductase NimA-like FMN-containing flavoprotein (pyridoxamine 5'-phosphate oxidase superfamily)
MPGADRVFEELSEPDCLALLGANHVGRIAVVVDDQPIVFPVNYALAGDEVVFRTNAGTKLAGAALGHVAFEIDSADEQTHEGWSVIVQGVGYEVTTSLDLHSEQLRRLDLQPWLPGERSHWVRIVANSITGRRLRRTE